MSPRGPDDEDLPPDASVPHATNGAAHDHAPRGGGVAAALVFPYTVHVKVMGRASTRFEAIVHAIISRHIAPEDLLATTSRESRAGRYVSVTLSIRARSQAQLDAIYGELARTDEVLLAL